MSRSYWHRLAARRVSRRRLLEAGTRASALAGAAWLVGCSSSASKPPAATSPASPTQTPAAQFGTQSRGARPGGTYRVATPLDFDTFDPHLSVGAAQAYLPRLYNAVINRSPNTNQFKFDDLAASLEQPDDTTYVFKVRPGVKVAPNQLGVPERALDGNDVKATFDRIVKLPQSNAFGFVGQWIASTDVAADGQSFTIRTKKPYGYFFVRIGSLVNLVIPRELVDRAPDMKAASAGGGPYVLARGAYTEGQSALLTRNPNYYRKDEHNGDAALPYIDAFDVKTIKDRAALQTAFRSGQTEEYTAPNVDEVNTISAGQSYTVVRASTNTFISVTLNPTRAPWKDQRVRLAAMYALRRQDYIDRVYKGAARANGLVHWSLGDYALPASELEQLQPYDPQKARQLIKAATGQDALEVNVMWPADTIQSEHSLHLPIWLQQMQEAGFSVRKDPQAFGTWLSNYNKINYDASLALNPPYEWAEVDLDFEHSEGVARNHIYDIGIGALYPEIDAAIDAAKGITDPMQQALKTREVQRAIYAKGPMFLPLVTPFSFTLYQPYVKNIPQGLGSSSYFLNTWYLDRTA